MSKPRTAKPKDKSTEKKKGEVHEYFKEVKKSTKSESYVENELIIGDLGVYVKHYSNKKGVKEKLIIKSLEKDKFKVIHVKNGENKESEHTLDEIKKLLDKNKDLSFVDKSLFKK